LNRAALSLGQSGRDLALLVDGARDGRGRRADRRRDGQKLPHRDTGGKVDRLEEIDRAFPKRQLRCGEQTGNGPENDAAVRQSGAEGFDLQHVGGDPMAFVSDGLEKLVLVFFGVRHDAQSLGSG